MGLLNWKLWHRAWYSDLRSHDSFMFRFDYGNHVPGKKVFILNGEMFLDVEIKITLKNVYITNSWSNVRPVLPDRVTSITELKLEVVFMILYLERLHLIIVILLSNVGVYDIQLVALIIS